MAIGIVQIAMKLLLSAKVAENELIASRTALTAARGWTKVKNDVMVERKIHERQR